MNANLDGLDSTDLRMALAALHYYLRAHELIHKTPSPAAYRLLEHLTCALADSGHESGVTCHTENRGRSMVSTAPQPVWLSTRQAATRLRCSQRTARRIAQRIGTRIGREWLLPADSLPGETK